jgi:hypothetical protein
MANAKAVYITPGIVQDFQNPTPYLLILETIKVINK